MIVSLAVSAILGTILEASCGDAVRIRVSDPAPKQGSIGVVEVKSETPLGSVGGFFAGEELHFWPDVDGRIFQALVGVDLHENPGDATLRANVVPKSGPAVECRVDLRVTDGGFPVQSLEVEPKYVEPSPEDAARSEREATELRRIFSSTTSERLWQRGFETPVAGQEASGSFGKRRIFNGKPRNPHSGEDFGAPAGSPVRAPARGRVVLAKNLFFLGNTVILDHGFGLFSFYGHLSAIDVELGALVDTGMLLGKVGATGRVTGAHLHWGARLGDARVNPMDLLRLGR